MAFFTLAWQMIICDLMTQTVQIIVAVPVTAAGEAVIFALIKIIMLGEMG
jgi:hypothetical protein